MIENITDKSRVNIHWKVSPYDYSEEKAESLARKFSKKYSIRKERVKIVPEFTLIGSEGESMSISKDVIGDIQDPKFQIELFKEFLRVNHIDGYDLDLILSIDSEINSKIDYYKFESHKRYSVKWIRWSNFLSYGKDNFFDFTQLNGMVLLSGEPANQSGKTTFAIDLLHFLLFGKTSKAATLDKVFNKYLKEETNVEVEGCITIDGEDYVIKRTLSRPQLSKRSDKSKTTQKIEYYKIVGGNEEELEDYIDEQQEENSVKTNKVIKESIGKESDFDLIMSVTESTLDDLVNKKEAERGRLLARWIGLLPMEQKDELAREKFNSSVKPYLLMNTYNSEKLSQEIEAYTLTYKSIEKSIKEIEEENKQLDKDIELFEKNIKGLMEAKSSIDNDLLNIDITTLERKISSSIEEGKRKKSEIEAIVSEMKEIGDVDFSVEAYDSTTNEISEANTKVAVLSEKYKTLSQTLKHLKSSEFCPTCGRKLDNIDNSAKIKEIENEIASVVEEGRNSKERLESLKTLQEKMKESREKYERKNKLNVKKSALEVNVERLRNEYKENISIKKEYSKNKDAIDKNNEIDIAVRNSEVQLQNKRNTKNTNIELIARHNSDVKSYKEQIETRKEIIEKIKNEEKLVKNWKIYLDMVGKDGVSKMVLRKAIPVINARLNDMLSDICDFDVEIGINNKNDVMFYIIKDGVYSDLSSGSGFELTASALALRAVLADMSTISRCSILILDEIFGRVAQENHDNIRNLIEKISKDYTAVFLITHLDEVKEWCTSNVVVKKENNVSKIALV